MTSWPSLPDGPLTTTSLALEYQVGQAAASMMLRPDALRGCVNDDGVVREQVGVVRIETVRLVNIGRALDEVVVASVHACSPSAVDRVVPAGGSR